MTGTNTLSPFTAGLVRDGFHRVKDIATALMEIEDYTGIEFDELCKMFYADETKPAAERIAAVSEEAIRRGLRG